MQRILSIGPLRWLGLISYGLYLWHWPIFQYLHPGRFGLNGWALVAMWRHRTALLPGGETTQVIETGPFAWSRNPLYVGLLVLSAGLALLAGSLWALAALPLEWALLRWGAVLPEEAYLSAKFGPTYADYSRRVRRWL